MFCGALSPIDEHVEVGGNFALPYRYMAPFPLFMLALSATVATEPAAPERFDDGAISYTLYPDSFLQLDEQIRQVRFKIEMADQETPLDEIYAKSGTVQVNCGTRESRVIGDAAEAANTTGNPGTSSSWETLGTSDEDQHIYRWLCERTPSGAE